MANSATPQDYLYRNDLWVLDDDLGLASAGDQVARMALEVEPPFSLCVAGKWGAGKTSVLRRAFFTLWGQPLKQSLAMAEEGLEEHCDAGEIEKLRWDHKDRKLARAEYDYPAKDEVLPIWFSPWQYQNEPNPLIPLILELQAQFSVRMKLKSGAQTFNRRGGLAVARLLEHLVDAAASVLVKKNISVARGVTDAMRTGWQDAEPDVTSIGDGQRFHLLFEDAVQELLSAMSDTTQTKARLIIFIDDLDRCEKEVIVRLLEAIKLYLNSRYCVFVLGLDSSAVMEALKKQRELPEDANREYLEKLFQATISVPLPQRGGIETWITNQLQQHGIPSSEKNTGTDAMRARMATDIRCLLEPNPRKIKNFLNSLCATWQMHAMEDFMALEDAPNVRLFTLYHYLRQFHQPIWRLLERQPSALRLLWKVLKHAPGNEPLGLIDIDEADQRLLEEFFSRAFSHVLRDNKPSDDFDPTIHRNQPLEEAIESFIQRQDRKCSDEYFVRCFSELHPKPQTLPDAFLYLKTDETR